MVISPVSNVLTKNNYNVEFGSKKNKKPQNEVRSSSSGMKAVPVIVLMAMSPLMANNINAANRLGNENNIELVSDINDQAELPKKVLREKTFKTGNGDCTLRFMSGNDDNTVSHINVRGTDSKGLPFNHYYDELNNIKLDIVGDDGKICKTIQFPMLLSHPAPSRINKNADKALCNYVKDFIDGKVETDLKSDIKVENFYNKIRPGANGDLQNVPNKTDWIKQGKLEHEDFGKTPEGMPENVLVRTKDCTFAISPYTTDENNKEGFQVVTVMALELGKYKVAGLRTSKINLKCGDDVIDTFDLNTIELYKRNSKEKVRIVNDELFKTLLEVTNDTRFDNAFELHPITSSNIGVFGKGIVYQVN